MSIASPSATYVISVFCHIKITMSKFHERLLNRKEIQSKPFYGHRRDAFFWDKWFIYSICRLHDIHTISNKYYTQYRVLTCSFSQMGQCLSERLYIQKVVVFFKGTYFQARLRHWYVLMCTSSHLTPLYHTTGHIKYMFVWTFSISLFIQLHLDTLWAAMIFIFLLQSTLFLQFW